ncbi:MAG: N-acetylneuraminate synthase [bacterium]
MNNCVFIIAEAGVNHNGSLKTAKKLVDAAKSANADAVKFQTFKANLIASPYAQKALYQMKNTADRESQYEMLKGLELSVSDYAELNWYCKEKKIKFLSSPFDLESIDLLHDLGLKIFKIPSGEITNLPYLREIGSFKNKIIMSTGMAEIGEIRDAIKILTKSGTSKKDIVLLHCNTEYPTPMKDVNLNALRTLKNTFKMDIGYSDHTLGIEIAVAAVAMGARVIEKHITLDKNMPGPDHSSSLEPREFMMMVESIRNIERALGDGIKRPSASEMKNISIVRKSIIAAKNIKKGERFSAGNLCVKRPGKGISPMSWDTVIGKRAKRNFKKDDLINI